MHPLRGAQQGADVEHARSPGPGRAVSWQRRGGGSRRPRYVPAADRARGLTPGVRAAPVLITHYSAPGHAKPGHPESPIRLEAILERLRQRGWVRPADGQEEAQQTQPPERPPAAARWGTPHDAPSGHEVKVLESNRVATLEELALVHPPSYIDAVRAACVRIQEPVLVDDSTYLAPASFHDCSRSVGSVLDLIDALLATGTCTDPSTAPAAPVGAALASTSTTAATTAATSATAAATSAAVAGFALVRPPGHHVLPTRPMGFGVFNTVSVAARYARERYGVERILIVDFDVHHGNGTMEIFYDDARTLYVSTHQAGLWPYTGKAREVGACEGRGATVNIPLPGGSGDAAMREAWRRVVLPAAERFGPGLVLVSAGLDAHWRDPLAGMQLSAQTYHWMCVQLVELSQRWCPGRLALVLEGGYETASLAECVEACLEGLLGRPATSAPPPPPPRALHEEPLARVEAVLQEVCRLHGL